MQIICFHNPDEENGYLSNWYQSNFIVDGVHFSSMEQFMMYRKAICFQDECIAEQILGTKDVAEIKALGRAVKDYDAKFSQNDELKDNLVNTGNVILAECAVKDRIWGIGLSMKDENRYDKSKWRGENLLGYTLMMVRERLNLE